MSETDVKIPKIYLPSYNDKRPYQIWRGSRFSAKSWTKAFFFLSYARHNEYFRAIYARNTQVNVRKSQFQLFKDIAKRNGIYEEFDWNKTDLTITNINNGNYMQGGSFEKPESMLSVPGVTDFWAEEPISREGSIDREKFYDISGTIRNPYGIAPRFHFTFNPININNFIYEDFYSDKKVYNDTELMDVIANYNNNPFCPQDRIDFLNKMKITNPERYKVDGLGEWGSVIPKNPFIYAKKDKLFNPNLEYDRRYPIWLSIDINNDPLTCLISQCETGEHSHTYGYIHTFDEIKVTPALMSEYPHFDKFQILCTVIRQRYPHAGIFLTGDASGWQGNTLLRGDTGSFYLYMAKLLSLNVNSQVMTPRSNLRHTVSQNLCNSALMNHPSIQVNPNTCPMLATEIEIAEISDKGKLIKDRDVYALDSFDAWRYQLATILDNWHV